MYRNTGMDETATGSLPSGRQPTPSCYFGKEGGGRYFVKSLEKVISLAASFIERFFGDGKERINIIACQLIE